MRRTPLGMLPTILALVLLLACGIEAPAARQSAAGLASTARRAGVPDLAIPRVVLPAPASPAGLLAAPIPPIAALPPSPPTVLPGAPVARPPAPLRVGLQVGHWQIADLPDSLARLRSQTGTEAAGRNEVDLNMEFARRTAGLLTRAGVQVDLLPATIPSGYRADAFVAIHADGDWTKRIRGYKIAPPYRSAVAWRDAVLVAQLAAAYSAATGLPRDPGITDNMRGYYAINGWMGDDSRIGNQTPGAVIETGFMTSPADRAVLFNHPDWVAAGLAAGILAFLRTANAPDAVQMRAATIAALAPTGCSLVVLQDGTPVRARPNPGAPVVAWVDRGAILPYLDSTSRPRGPFTDTQGRQLVTRTGYYRVAPPGGGPPAYINHAPSIVQLPGP